MLTTWLPAAALAVAVTLAISACSGGDSAPRSAKPPSREDFVAQAGDFRNLHTMTQVRDFYIDNRLGHLDEALAVANSPRGGSTPSARHPARSAGGHGEAREGLQPFDARLGVLLPLRLAQRDR